MNKADRIAVALLFCLLIGWTFYGKKYLPAPTPPDAPVSEEQSVSASNVVSEVEGEPREVQQVAEIPEDAAETIEHASPEKTVVLENDVLRLVLTSWGGGIRSAELSEYPETMEDDSGPVLLDFSNRPSLTYEGLEGLSEGDDFSVVPWSQANGVTVSRETGDGLVFERTVELTNGYAVSVVDTFKNSGDAPLALPDVQLSIGPMAHIHSKASTRGISYLGVDSLSSDDDRVQYWGKQIKSQFGVKGGCSRQDMTLVPLTAQQSIEGPVMWICAKNKFFAEILQTSEAGEGGSLSARRETEGAGFALAAVSGAVHFGGRVLQPGESFERTSTYYVGPKRYSTLNDLGHKQGHIMMRAWRGWGWWRSACVGLLWLLNGLKFLTRNYGIAIILLTVIVKVVFWPLTHKSTENMKRMQQLSPELTKLREKYKDDPKKLQEKQMLLYRQNGVNPLAGCLPMFVQMPVFIALFTVLRSAVELRFASFLWIQDLSEPEGLLAGVLPFPAGGLNLLPLAMTGTMIIQQRLTPSAGDPQQQKMMQFMPLMMLFIFYNMASALVLYWTISQLLSILQLVMQQRKEKAQG